MFQWMITIHFYTACVVHMVYTSGLVGNLHVLPFHLLKRVSHSYVTRHVSFTYEVAAFSKETTVCHVMGEGVVPLTCTRLYLATL